MNYKHKSTGKKAVPVFDKENRMYHVDGMHDLLPEWLFKDSNDWEEIKFSIGDRAYSPRDKTTFTKTEKGWEAANIIWGVHPVENLFLNKNALPQSGKWELLDRSEKTWKTLDNREIPFSKVTHQHWSNIYHYHAEIMCLEQCMIAKGQIDAHFDGVILPWIPYEQINQ